MRRFWVAAFMFFSVTCFAGSVTLVNDSLYPLIAEIYDSMGNKIGNTNLSPGFTFIWYDNMSPFIRQNNGPYTPFTVRWLCATGRPYDYVPPEPRSQTAKQQRKKPEYQSEYGSWTNVSTGSVVNAVGSVNGSKTCVMQKTNKKKATSSKKGTQTSGFQNWSNDGGQTWQNNAGPGWNNNDGSPLDTYEEGITSEESPLNR